MIVESIDFRIVSRPTLESILAHAHVRGISLETIHILGSIEPTGNNSLCVETIGKERGFSIVSRVAGVLELGGHLRGLRTLKLETAA